MPTILVTGGAGYIGSHVVKELVHQNHKPIVFDNLQTGHRKAIENALFIEGDLSDQRKLAEVFQANSVDAVMHFAADCLVGESVQDPLKYFNNNVKNSLKLIEIMEQFYVKQIVFSSSAAVYGEPEEMPISEGHPCAPTNPYGETKWIIEKVLQAFHDGGKLNFISLRYFNAAGADPEGELGEDHSRETHLIPLVIKAALDTTSVPIFGTDYETPDGTCIRDYIHVTDLAHAHILALRKLDQGKISGIYNLGNGNGYSVRDVVDTVKKVTGRNIATVESPRRPGDPARLVASSQKMRHELGWIPRYPDLETIVKTAYDWHRKHPKGYDDENTA
ncbi:MAG: UDP-glucose 4-epimerase GalE [Thermodesulfobacteriota bacterium]|jgi:UDP-glucose 4-epimerase